VRSWVVRTERARGPTKLKIKVYGVISRKSIFPALKAKEEPQIDWAARKVAGQPACDDRLSPSTLLQGKTVRWYRCIWSRFRPSIA